MRTLAAVPVLLSLLAAACSDLPTEGRAPSGPAEPGTLRMEVRCTANVALASLSCGEPDAAGPGRSLIIGGQNVYVRLASTGAGYNPSDSIFQIDVTVQNLMAQAFGTADGEVPTGLRVFFETGPSVTAGTGTAEVDNEDGTLLFLSAEQPYFAYPELLGPGWESEPRPWRFKVDPEVERFAFTVYVQGDLPHEESLLLFRPESVDSSVLVFGLWGTSADNVFAVGADSVGTVLRYTAGAWTRHTLPTEQVLLDVWGSSGSDVFAVGSGGAIVHWDGAAWDTMTSGLECSCKSLWGVWGSGPDDVFAVGDDGVVAHYDGTSWTVGDTLPATVLYGVWGSGPNDVFAVGEEGGIFHYDGTEWSRMTSGLEDSGGYLNAVWGLSPTDVYAAASTGVLHYDGTEWSPLEGAQECEHLSVWGTSANDLFVANVCGIDHWNGSTWAYMDPGGFVLELWGAGPLHLLTNGDFTISRGRR